MQIETLRVFQSTRKSVFGNIVSLLVTLVVVVRLTMTATPPRSTSQSDLPLPCEHTHMVMLHSPLPCESEKWFTLA